MIHVSQMHQIPAPALPLVTWFGVPHSQALAEVSKILRQNSEIPADSHRELVTVIWDILLNQNFVSISVFPQTISDTTDVREIPYAVVGIDSDNVIREYRECSAKTAHAFISHMIARLNLNVAPGDTASRATSLFRRATVRWTVRTDLYEGVVVVPQIHARKTMFERALTMDALVRNGTVHPEAERIIRSHLDRPIVRLVVVGAPMAGKTTLLNATLALFRRGQQIIVYGDTWDVIPMRNMNVILPSANPLSDISVINRSNAAHAVIGEIISEHTGKVFLNALQSLQCVFATLHATPLDVGQRILSLAGYHVADAFVAQDVMKRITIVLHVVQVREGDGKPRRVLMEILESKRLGEPPALVWSHPDFR